jgi:hypothetical protein
MIITHDGFVKVQCFVIPAQAWIHKVVEITIEITGFPPARE